MKLIFYLISYISLSVILYIFSNTENVAILKTLELRHAVSGATYILFRPCTIASYESVEGINCWVIRSSNCNNSHSEDGKLCRFCKKTYDNLKEPTKRVKKFRESYFERKINKVKFVYIYFVE